MGTMNLTDKVLIYLLESFTRNNNSSKTSFTDVAKNFYEYEESQLINAVTKLKTDRFIEIMYYNSIPGAIFVTLSAFNQINEDTFADKGYNSYCEIMDIILTSNKR